MARNRNRKSRLTAMSDDHRVSLREQAVDMARKGLAVTNQQQDAKQTENQMSDEAGRSGQDAALRRLAEGERQRASRGPVHEGSPQAQETAAKPRQGMKRKARDETARRSFTLSRNETSNARSGQFFRTITRAGGVLHDYAGTKNDVFVPKAKHDTGGTGNVAKPNNASKELQSLAIQRSQAKRGGKRKLLSTARASSYGRVDRNQDKENTSFNSLMRDARRGKMRRNARGDLVYR